MGAITKGRGEWIGPVYQLLLSQYAVNKWLGPTDRL